jgi:hypothetical protein
MNRKTIVTLIIVEVILMIILFWRVYTSIMSTGPLLLLFDWIIFALIAGLGMFLLGQLVRYVIIK